MSSAILTKEECMQERVPDQLYAWLFEKIGLFHSLTRGNPKLERKLLLHEGLFKQFYEEMYPLALFAKNRYGRRTDVLVKWIPGSQHYDAVVSNEDEDRLFVEITQTCFDRKEGWRMEYLLQRGRKDLVSLTGKVKCEGTKTTGHRISVEHGFVFAGGEKLDEERTSLLRKALRRKSNKPRGHYAPNTILVVAVDDCFWFVDEHDWRIVKEVVGESTSSPAWPFGATFFVGVPRESFREFGDTERFLL